MSYARRRVWSLHCKSLQWDILNELAILQKGVIDFEIYVCVVPQPPALFRCQGQHTTFRCSPALGENVGHCSDFKIRRRAHSATRCAGVLI